LTTDSLCHIPSSGDKFVVKKVPIGEYWNEIRVYEGLKQLQVEVISNEPSYDATDGRGKRDLQVQRSLSFGMIFLDDCIRTNPETFAWTFLFPSNANGFLVDLGFS